SDVTPSKNSIVPVAAVGVTDAVKVTACPKVEGFKLDVCMLADVAVFGLFTVCVKAGDDVLVANEPSPPYTAVILCDPALNADVAKVATPALKAPVPSVAAPSLKVTVPPGVPAPGVTTVTVAVNVTL